MKIVVSPAKSLDFETKLPTTRGTQPAFLETTEKINKKLQRFSKKEIADLMGISDKLADVNYMRFRNLRQNTIKKIHVPQYMLLREMFIQAWMRIPFQQKNWINFRIS